MLFLEKDFEMSRDIENLFSSIPWENQFGTCEIINLEICAGKKIKTTEYIFVSGVPLKVLWC